MVGTLFDVAQDPVPGDVSDAVQVLEDDQVQDLLAVGAIEALDLGVLHGFDRLDVLQLDLVFFRPQGQGQGNESGSLSDRTRQGYSRRRTTDRKHESRVPLSNCGRSQRPRPPGCSRRPG